MLGRFGIRAFPLAPLAFFLAFLLGTSFASKKNVDKSISYKGRPICTTEKCFKVAVSLYGAMSKKANVDPCENWDECEFCDLGVFVAEFTTDSHA